MKTIIKIDTTKALVIEPAEMSNGVNLNLTIAGMRLGGAVLSPDQCGVIIFALEQAIEQNAARAAA